MEGAGVITAGQENTGDFFGVVDVHLAAESFDEEGFAVGNGGRVSLHQSFDSDVVYAAHRL